MNTALFGLKNLQEHTCMVFETCKKQQQLLNWKAKFITAEQIRNAPSLAHAESEILEGKVPLSSQKKNESQNNNTLVESSLDVCDKNIISSPQHESETEQEDL